MSVNSEKDWFTFKIVYFKPSGKFYTSQSINWEVRVISNGPGHRSPYMADAIDKLRGLRDSGGPGALPGLSKESDGWYGPILIDCEDGFPHLILPAGINL